MTEEKRLVTAKELAETLNLSVETIWRYTREKRIPNLEMGPRQYRYIISEVVQALSSQSEVREEPSVYAAKDKINHKEFAELPAEAGSTLQLIDGLVIREPSPVYQHQRISRRIQQILIAYFEENDPNGEVFNAPLDVYLDEYTVVQPDLFYLPSDRPAKSNPVDSLPALVVEILSPSTVRTDRVRKLNSYQKAGVKHYWIVDLQSQTMECLKLVEQNYLVVISLATGVLEHPDFPNLNVDLEMLFSEP